MSETLFYNPGTTIATNTIATGNISVNLDLLDQWLYLRPSVSNAATIVAGMSRFCNTYGQSVFGTNVFATNGLSNASVFGSTTTTSLYGGVYMAGGYVFFVDGNGGGTCPLVSSKENTVTNYAVSGTGGNTTSAGCLLPDGRALIMPSGAGRNFVIWNNITRTSTTLALPAGYTKFQMGGQIADGNIALYTDSASNCCILNTTTFTFSNNASLGARVFSIFSQLDVTGNVIIAPNSAANGIGVWNPAAGTVYSVTATGVNDYCGPCAVAGDGRVIFGPATLAFLPTYNPFTLTYTSYAAPWSAGGLKFGALKTLPDGGVLLCPGYGGTFFAIFNHITNSITTFTQTNPVGGAGFQGANFVPDGRLIFANTTGASNVPVMTSLSRGVPEAWCLHPFFNHR